MPTPLREGGWWTAELAGAPRWLIAFALAVLLACIFAVVFNGPADGGTDEGAGVIVSSPSASPTPVSPTPGGSPTAAATPSTAPSASASPSASTSSTPLLAGPVRVAFIGDSSAAGVGASTPSARWTTRLSTRLGWSEFDYAVAGTGYLTSVTENAPAVCGLAYCPNYEETVPQAQAVNPDVVVLSGGRYDIDPDATRQERVTAALRTGQAVERTIASLRSTLPDAAIVVISPIWDDDAIGPTFRAYRDSVRAATESLGATYIDIGEPLAGRSDLVAADGVNPNDAGHQAIADAIGTPAIPAP